MEYMCIKSILIVYKVIEAIRSRKEAWEGWHLMKVLLLNGHGIDMPVCNAKLHIKSRFLSGA